MVVLFLVSVVICFFFFLSGNCDFFLRFIFVGVLEVWLREFSFFLWSGVALGFVVKGIWGCRA